MFLGVIIGGIGVWYALRDTGVPRVPRQLRMFTIVRGKGIEEAAISPDGSSVAFTQNHALFVYDFAHGDTRAVAGTSGARGLFWSPGSETIGYTTEGSVWSVSVAGGQPTLLCTVASPNILGGAWSADGHIIFAIPAEGLFTIPEQGGDPKRLVQPDSSRGEFDFHYPSLLPGGEGVLTVIHGADNWIGTIALVENGTRRPLVSILSSYLFNPHYSPTGHLVFSEQSPRDGIWAIAFSADAKATTGEPFLVRSDARFPSVANDGSLVCVSSAKPVMRLAWVTRQGRLDHYIGEPLDQIRTPSVSPDGKRVAVVGYQNGVMDIWIFDIAQGIQSCLPTKASLDNSPIWSPKGDRVAWTSGTWGGDQNLVTQRADGVGTLDTLLLGAYIPLSWTPDGKQIICLSNGQIFVADIGDRSAKPKLFDVSSKVSRARLSPDGRYLAYLSAETGRREVYITPFPAGGRKWRASTTGGILPSWADEGREVVFLQGSMIVSVQFSDRRDVLLGDPQALFTPDSLRGFLYSFSARAFDPAPDGRHFAVVTEAESDDKEPNIILLENWQTGLDKRRP